MPKNPALKLHPNEIQRSIHVAQENWKDWQSVFEHCGTIASNPLLADPKRFALFCREYSVARTLRRGTQNQFRLALVKSLPKVIKDDRGRRLDKLEEKLRVRFGTCSGTRRIVSVLSKVAAFVRPAQFVAWDKFGKRGVNIVLGRSANFSFDTYAEYLDAFNQVWRGHWGKQIRGVVTTAGQASSIEREPRFMRRVLDVCLMRRGGRKDI